MLFTKQIFHEFIFSFLSYTHIIISSVSNYNNNSLLIKTFSSLLLIAYYLYLHKYNYKLKFDLFNTVHRRFFLVLTLFLIIASISLFTGKLNLLGMQKFYLIVIQLIPLIIISRYALYTWTKGRTLAFITVALAIGIFASVFSLIISPFNPFIIYNFSFTRWSHVAFGRFIVIPIILSFFLMYSSINKNRVLVSYSIASLLIFTLISTGFRAGVIAVAFFLVSLLLFSTVKQKQNIFSLKNILLIILLIGLPLFIYGSQPVNFLNRLESIEQISIGENIKDGSLTTRINAYKIAWTNGWEKPTLGHGLGTFQFAGGDFTKAMKYPHNIFLEFFYEMGLIGLIFLILILLLILISIKKHGYWLLSLYCIFLWLSLFSKDIPSNVLLFAGLAFIKNEKL